MPYPRVKIKSVAQGCKDLPPVAGLKRSLHWACGQARLLPFIWQFESDLMCFLNTIDSSGKSNILIKCSRFVFGAINKVPLGRRP